MVVNPLILVCAWEMCPGETLHSFSWKQNNVLFTTFHLWQTQMMELCVRSVQSTFTLCLTFLNVVSKVVLMPYVLLFQAGNIIPTHLPQHVTSRLWKCPCECVVVLSVCPDSIKSSIFFRLLQNDKQRYPESLSKKCASEWCWPLRLSAEAHFSRLLQECSEFAGSKVMEC